MKTCKVFNILPPPLLRGLDNMPSATNVVFKVVRKTEHNVPKYKSILKYTPAQKGILGRRG